MMLTLTLIALMTLLVTYVTHVAHTYAPLALRMQEQIKARSLALSGVEVAKAQLAQAILPQKDKKESEQERKKRFFASLMRRLNVMQQFQLKKSVDGIDGTIKLYLTSEEGKLNLNSLWDEEKKALIAAFAKSPELEGLKSLFAQLENVTEMSDLLNSWQSFMKKRGELLNDVTQLLLLQEYRKFADSLFLNPQQQDGIFLTDLFSLWNPRTTIDPFLFSPSWLAVLKLTRTNDALEGLVERFTPDNNWKSSWDKVLGSFYQKNFNSLPKSIDSMLGTTFDPHFFSVVSYGVVGSSTVIVYAIIELNEQKKEDATAVDIKVRKLYWL